MRCLDSFTDSMDMNLSKLWEIARTGNPGILQSMGLQRAGYDLAIEQQQEEETEHSVVTWFFPSFVPQLTVWGQILMRYEVKYWYYMIIGWIDYQKKKSFRVQQNVVASFIIRGNLQCRKSLVKVYFRASQKSFGLGLNAGTVGEYILSFSLAIPWLKYIVELNIINANDSTRRENLHSIIKKASFATDTFKTVILRGEWTQS